MINGVTLPTIKYCMTIIGKKYTVNSMIFRFIN